MNRLTKPNAPMPLGMVFKPLAPVRPLAAVRPPAAGGAVFMGVPLPVIKP